MVMAMAILIISSIKLHYLSHWRKVQLAIIQRLTCVIILISLMNSMIFVLNLISLMNSMILNLILISLMNSLILIFVMIAECVTILVDVHNNSSRCDHSPRRFSTLNHLIIVLSQNSYFCTAFELTVFYTDPVIWIIADKLFRIVRFFHPT